MSGDLLTGSGHFATINGIQNTQNSQMIFFEIPGNQNGGCRNDLWLPETIRSRCV